MEINRPALNSTGVNEVEKMFRPVLSATEKNELEKLARDYNLKINPERQPQQNMGRDDFLKILITQLSYQDPTAPMQDKEFIAQMAQFSSLEQMTAMAKDFSKLTAMIGSGEASSSLGKNVEIIEGERIVQGAVQAVTRGGNPQVLVDGNLYNWDQVVRVFAE
ncbi:MAG: flagellar hook assembly protein FlgD [Treponema sp.]|jgi:flagellar basal-body rod modification protein FlgD|nr:flagellar hook assembly protein FlgD [Treponema sp.]